MWNLSLDEATAPALGKLESMVREFFWLLPNIGIAILALLGFIAAAWSAKHAVLRYTRRRSASDLGALLAAFVKWAVIVVGVLVAATIIFPSISPASLLGTLGIGTVAIGFAFKDILQNWFSGFLILYRQPFRRGDQIKSGEFEGTVEHIEARATLIKTYDGQLVVIPNSDIYTRAVIVRTAFTARRSEYDIGISYDADLDKACDVIAHAVRTSEGVHQEPTPEALPWSLDDSSITIKARWWTKPQRSEIVRTHARVIRNVRAALAAADIEIPYPTRSLIVHQAPD